MRREMLLHYSRAIQTHETTPITTPMRREMKDTGGGRGTHVVEDLLEGIVGECCHGMGVVSVTHADGVVDGLQHSTQSVHVDLRGFRLQHKQEKLVIREYKAHV